MAKRKRRTRAEWQTLIEQQKVSGLNGAAFCRQHHLCRKIFYARRKDMPVDTKLDTSIAGQFIQVMPEIVEPVVKPTGPVLYYRDSHVQFSPDIDTAWVANLMKALS